MYLDFELGGWSNIGWWTRCSIARDWRDGPRAGVLRTAKVRARGWVVRMLRSRARAIVATARIASTLRRVCRLTRRQAVRRVGLAAGCHVREALVVGGHGRDGRLLTACCSTLSVVDVGAASGAIPMGHGHLLRTVHTGSTTCSRPGSLSRSSRVAVGEGAASIPLAWLWTAHGRGSETSSTMAFLVVAVLRNLLSWERVQVRT